MQKESQRHNDKRTSKDFFRKICTFHFIVRVRKGYSRFSCERELETEQRLQYIDPHSYDRQRCVFLVLQGCSTGGPGAQLSVECWLSLRHLVTNGSPKLLRAPSARCGFLYHILSATSLDPNSDFLFSQSYIIVQSLTQSPTQSLEWHI